MVAMDSIRIEMNPDQRYIDEIISEIVRTEDWNKTKECEIWKKGHDVYEFYVAIDSDTDKPVGSISITKDRSLKGDTDDDLYYIGNFYTREGYRGIGLGVKLFNLIMERTKGTNVNLNAVPKLADFYDKKFGFIFYPEYFNVHCKIDTAKMNVNRAIDCKEFNVVDVVDADLDTVVAYDRIICPRERSRYLKAWICFDDAITKVALDKNGSVVGFACVRPQLKSERLSVGPFYAENKEIAEILLHKLLSYPEFRTYEQVWIRFPEVNTDAMGVIESMVSGDFVKVRSTKIQFTKKLIEPNPVKVFSIFEAAHCIV